MNTPAGNTVSTAQLALSLLCGMARSLPQADMSIKEVRNGLSMSTYVWLIAFARRESGTAKWSE